MIPNPRAQGSSDSILVCGVLKNNSNIEDLERLYRLLRTKFWELLNGSGTLKNYIWPNYYMTSSIGRAEHMSSRPVTYITS